MDYQVIADRVTGWFQSNARSLPWRRRRTGYTALVSEFMLQQTQVDRVVEHYKQFLRRFPTIRHLAASNEEGVLEKWQGLGYYGRARRLHRAAQLIVQQHGGRVPKNVDMLQELPGVGRYTAGAIASIVFGKAEPIVDGNVRRVLARLAANAESGDALTAWAWNEAKQLVECATAPGTFNEGLMELGATVCTPRQPACARCPLGEVCKARRLDAVAQYPASNPSGHRRILHHHAVVITRAGCVYLEKRPDKGTWAGMWQSPTIESNQPLTTLTIARQLPIAVAGLVRRGSFRHVLSHQDITFHVLVATSRARKGHWRSLNDLTNLPFSNAQRRVMAMAQT